MAQFLVKLNIHMENIYESLAKLIVGHPKKVFGFIFLILTFLSSGILFSSLNTEYTELWVRPGSRIIPELDYLKEKFPSLSNMRDSYLMGRRYDGLNILTEDSFEAFYEVDKKVTFNISTELFFNGSLRTFYYDDICARFEPDPIMKEKMLPFGLNEYPCYRMSPIDCFKEGDYDYTLQDLHPDIQENLYLEKESFYNQTDYQNDVFLKIGSICQLWNMAPISPNFIFGGNTFGLEIALGDSRAMQAIFKGAPADVIAKRLFKLDSHEEPTEEQVDQAEEIILSWEKAYLDYFIENKYTLSDVLYYDVFAQRSINDVVSGAGTADYPLIFIGYILMAVFASLALSRMNAIKSRALLGAFGVIMIMFGILASFGTLSWLGYQYTPTVTQVMPFLALGIGVDDLFVLASHGKIDHNKKDPARAAVLNCLKQGGISCTLTSLCNICTFFIASSFPIPLITAFCVGGGIAVIINFVVNIFMFTSMLYIDAQRQVDNRYDCLFCITSKKDIETTNKIDCLQKNLMSIRDKVAKTLVDPAIKFLITILFGFIFLTALYNTVLGEIPVGLEMGDIVPEESYVSPFLSTRDTMFKDMQATLVLGRSLEGPETIAYETSFDKIFQLEEDLQDLPESHFLLVIQLQSPADLFTVWLAREANDNSTYAKYCEGSYDLVHTVYSDFQKKLNSSADDVLYCMPTNDPELFKEAISLFKISDMGAGVSAMLPLDEDGSLISILIPIYPTNMETADEFASYIRKSRKICDDSEIPAYPTGFLYVQYEQYLDTRNELWLFMFITFGAISCISIFFLFHPIAVFIMVLIIASVIFAIWGWMPIFDFVLSDIGVVNLVMAVGITVEFTGHISRHFVTCQGTLNQRVTETMKALGGPVIFAAISTFLGICPLVMANFRYYRIYYFQQYLVIILIGLASGVLLLPVILSMFGPPSIISSSKIAPEENIPEETEKGQTK